MTSTMNTLYSCKDNGLFILESFLQQDTINSRFQQIVKEKKHHDRKDPIYMWFTKPDHHVAQDRATHD